MLTVENLCVCYGQHAVLDDVSFAVEEGSWLMLVGPNGAGKSTVVNAISQGVDYEGKISFEGRDIRGEAPKQLAKKLGVLTQNHNVAYAFTVGEIVRLGRYAYGKGVLGGQDEKDGEMLRYALEMTGLAELEQRSVLTLSGGELQRTFLAQIFAQNPKLLLLDEPTNHLDLVYQKQVFGLIENWLKEPGRAVVSVVHDLSLAKAYGSHALLLDRGRVQGMGPVREVLGREKLAEVYQIDVYGWMQNMLEQWRE